MQIVQSSSLLKQDKITLQLRQTRWLPPATESFQACSSCCSSALFSPALQLSACKRGLDGRSTLGVSQSQLRGPGVHCVSQAAPSAARGC